MAENKTKQTTASVAKFLGSVKDEKRRADCQVLVEIMSAITGEVPRMWGPSIIGFGSVHYIYESGREGDMPKVGFSPRKEALTLYILDGFKGEAELLKSLGKCKTGKCCVYIKTLDDINMPTLKKMIRECVKHVSKKWP